MSELLKATKAFPFSTKGLSKRTAPFDPSLRGVQLQVALYNFVFTHQLVWNQKSWFQTSEDRKHQDPPHCGSSFCMGGWTVRVCGFGEEMGKRLKNKNYKGEIGYDIMDRAGELLEISKFDATWLFNYLRTLDEIHHYTLTRLQGFDGNGFDRDGFNKEGLNQNGYERYPFGFQFEPAALIPLQPLI